MTDIVAALQGAEKVVSGQATSPRIEIDVVFGLRSRPERAIFRPIFPRIKAKMQERIRKAIESRLMTAPHEYGLPPEEESRRVLETSGGRLSRRLQSRGSSRVHARHTPPQDRV